VVLDEQHRRPPGPVVVELVDVEGRHVHRVAVPAQVVGGQLGGAGRVDEPGHRHDQDRPVELRQLSGQLVQPCRIKH